MSWLCFINKIGKHLQTAFIYNPFSKKSWDAAQNVNINKMWWFANHLGPMLKFKQPKNNKSDFESEYYVPI